jgi:8-oxo-dGTP pyrophosphatase MutT (NUDIX family)
MALVDRIRDVAPLDFSRVRPLHVDGAVLAWLPHATADALRRHSDVFEVSEREIRLRGTLTEFEARSAAIDRVVRALHRDGLIETYRNERYAIATSFHAEPKFAIDRGAVTRLGMRAYGVHLNGHVGRGDAMRLWVARRADDKATWPGKLDHIAAGGQPMGIGLRENLIKEAREEAGIPASLAARARPAGLVSFITENRYGIDIGTLFAFDLELPADFVPRGEDGEVAEFELWPIGKVIERLGTTTNFVFDSALVVIDFLVRHGFVAPDDPDYPEIVGGLRR